MKYGFQNHLKIEKLDSNNYKLLDNLDFRFKNLYITVEQGFITDLASAKLGNFQLRGLTECPSVLHDWNYTKKKYSRFKCDWIFYKSLRLEGVNILKASLYFITVRIFGGEHYE